MLASCIGASSGYSNACKFLNVDECNPEKCSFHKTVQQQEASLVRSLRRIRSLPYKRQVEIANTFYNCDLTLPESQLQTFRQDHHL